MDPLTHVALGAACAAVASPRTEVRLAAATGALAALLPDADVLIRSSDDALLVLEWHRQFTHSLLFIPFGAAFVAGAVHLARRRRDRFARLFVAAVLGIASHTLLDAATSYGTQLLWPFSDRRFAWNVVSVVDPAFTLPLLVFTVLALRRRRRRLAGAALAWAALYLSLGFVQERRVAEVQQRIAAARGHEIGRGDGIVKPTLGNLVLWSSVYLADGGYHIDAIRLPPFAPRGRAAFSEGGSAPSLEADAGFAPPPPGTRAARDLERFRRVSEGWLARHPGQREVVGDVRYAMLPDSLAPLWGIRLDESHREDPVPFETFRDAGEETRERFRGLLSGAEPMRPVP